MSCPAEGTLRSWMDDELPAAEKEEMQAHLANCALCRGKVSDLRSMAKLAATTFEPLGSPEPAAQDVVAAYRKFQNRLAEAPERQRARWLRWLPMRMAPLGGAFAAACVLLALFSFAPARTWGQKILQMLRVQKVAVVPIDFSEMGLNNPNGQSAGKMLTQLVSDSTVITMKPGAPQLLPDEASAGRLAGFSVRSLSSLGTPRQVYLSGEGAFHVTLDRDRIEDLLAQVGRSDIAIPAAVDGSTIAVHVPKTVRLTYGNCPAEGRKAGADDADTADCLSFRQLPSPVVSVPPTLDIGALAEAGLEVAGMSADEAHALCRTIDWSSTLLLPVPRSGSTSRTVAVDGVNGTLIETAARGARPSEYALLWINGGMLYSINGTGNSARGLAAAQSVN